MSRRIPLRSPVRIAAMGTLSRQAEPLTMDELARMVGMPKRTVYDVLVRAARCGWVQRTRPLPVFGSRPYYYTITDAGREWLAGQSEKETCT